MGQQDVLKYLEYHREKGEGWLTAKQIEKGLRELGLSNGAIVGLHSDLLRLSAFNIIEMRSVGLWDNHKEFRAHKSNMPMGAKAINRQK